MKWVCVERREGTEREGEEEVVRWWKRREPLWVERDERVEEEEEEEEEGDGERREVAPRLQGSSSQL
jgi:hypothetical protein